jgi:hypothetical protein
MSFIAFAYTDDLGSIQFFECDVDLSRMHRREAMLTDFPVEDGTTITDHVIIRPDTLTMEIMVSDTPLAANTAYREVGSLLSRSQRAVEKLDKVFRDKRLLTVATPLFYYESMIITSLEIPEDQEHAGAAYASISFRELQFAQSQAVLISAARTQALKRAQTVAELATSTLTAAMEKKQALDRLLVQKFEATLQQQELADEFVAAAGKPDELKKIQDREILKDIRAEAGL